MPWGTRNNRTECARLFCRWVPNTPTMLTLDIDNQTLEFQKEFLYHNAQLPWEGLHREGSLSRYLIQAMEELRRERMVILGAEGQTITLFGITYEDVRLSLTFTGKGLPCRINTIPQGQVHIAIFATRQGAPREGFSPAACRRLRVAWEQEAADYYRKHFERLHRQAAQSFLEEAERKLEGISGQVQDLRNTIQQVTWLWEYAPAERVRK